MKRKILFIILAIIGLFFFIGLIGNNFSTPQTSLSKVDLTSPIPSEIPSPSSILNPVLTGIPTPIESPAPGPISEQTYATPNPTVNIPNGATAICNDGTYSYSQHRQGTCSYHGGVSQWL